MADRCERCREQMDRLQQVCGHCGWVRGEAVRQTGDETTARHEREALFVARYEQRQYALSPQQENETAAVFIARINREKTDKILEAHQRTMRRLEKIPERDQGLKHLAREPGSDDDLE